MRRRRIREFQNVRLGTRYRGTPVKTIITIDPRIFGRIRTRFGDAMLAVEFYHKQQTDRRTQRSRIRQRNRQFASIPHLFEWLCRIRSAPLFFHDRWDQSNSGGVGETLDWIPV